MRDYKFRAWNITEQKMLDWDTDLYDDELALKFKDESDYVFMQGTGLKDKVGVDIYEGDIIYTDKKKDDSFGGRTFEVRWSPDTGCYGLFKGDSFSLVVYAYEQTVKGCKVLGNIYQNFELLKAED